MKMLPRGAKLPRKCVIRLLLADKELRDEGMDGDEIVIPLK